MVDAAIEVTGKCRAQATAYTVVSKSGQRGVEFSDARQAALAFLQAAERDGPFVMRHCGAATSVIASVKAGMKIAMPDGPNGIFRREYLALAGARGLDVAVSTVDWSQSSGRFDSAPYDAGALST